MTDQEKKPSLVTKLLDLNTFGLLLMVGGFIGGYVIHKNYLPPFFSYKSK